MTTTADNLPATTAANTPALAPSAEMLAKMKAKAHGTDFKATDLLVPYLVIVQGTSGYRKRSEPEFIPGAEEGDILDTLSLELRAQVAVILCKYEMNYTTWGPNRGKLIKQWGNDPSGYDAAQGDYGTRVDAEGNDIVPTAVYYALVLNDKGGSMPVKWSLGGTQFKKSRRINSLIAMLEFQTDDGPFNPPMFSRIYNLSTVPESNDQGSWFGWKIEPGPLTLAIPGGEALFVKAEQFRDAVEAGQVQEATPEQREVGTRRAGAPSGGAGTQEGDDVPF